ncbi:CpsD/CapB family tyrosine-protein kinase [Butyrivibrio sp. INlla16]|uniref:CpsD/CapB family tyrosine-protein kinase n=1 Tax=Butyrivibrio sp. INlla16 TaxID=1520807 RepID=UPI00088B5817|nr:CpsD/CapB family tyrosine-protein kinase [Butyrivibrio sp. INlla16]SDB69136.1 capsular exopolysaccharide family [Butyrivibrio sp. INlla16]
MKKLDIYKNDNYILKDAFDEAVMNLHILKKQNGYRSFVVCGCEAGNGTTTVAINLAAALAESGWKTVLIDGDMRKKNRYKRLNENATVGLSDYLMDKAPIGRIKYDTTTENLTYIPCGELIDNPVRLLCSNKMNVAREELANDYDFIIYDMPAINSAMDAEVIAVSADATILVSAVGATSKKGLIKAANALKETKANLIGTIINRTDMEQYTAYHEDYDYFQNERYVKKMIKGKRKKR